MNLTEALDMEIPELPIRAGPGLFKLHPKLIAKEHIVDGIPVVRTVVSGGTDVFQFPPEHWKLLQLFNGERDYEEISDLYFSETGVRYDPSDIRDMAEGLDAQDFWYRSPQEKNIRLRQQMSDDRRKQAKRKSRHGDVSHMYFSAWDPDQYLQWVLDHFGFIYTRWFTVLTLAAFAFMGYIFVSRWSELWRDTWQFYNFAAKGFWDIVEFWVLACALMFFHETAHGLTCKKFGGAVHHMGFQLIYMTPAFYTEVAEGWVTGNRSQRMWMIVAGVWSELMFCAVATPVWWGTPPGTFAHEFAYKVMLITGIGVVMINWNPLIRLDGYYLLSEYLSIPDLKEASTAFVSGWVKRNVWRLPVDVPYVPRRRRLGYAIYALASGAYSYSLLLFFARFAGNIFRNWTPEWAFVPSTLVGLALFRSRIKNLGRFMKQVYLDKKDLVIAWFTPARRAVVGGVILLALFVPFFREHADGRFLLEPSQRAVLRAMEEGTVVGVTADEGRTVQAGQTVVRLRNLKLESEAAQAAADRQAASARARLAQARYTDFGPALQEQQRAAEQDRILAQRLDALNLVSPISGTELTPRLSDRVGSTVAAGTELASIGDLRRMRARIYVPEHEIQYVRAGGDARLHFDSLFTTRSAKVVEITPASTNVPAGLTEKEEFKGIRPPAFYAVVLELDNTDGVLQSGMSGTAKVYGRRRSLLGLATQTVADFLGRKIW